MIIIHARIQRGPDLGICKYALVPPPPLKTKNYPRTPNPPTPPRKKFWISACSLNTQLQVFLLRIESFICTVMIDICQFCTIAGSFYFQISCCNTVLAHLSHYGMILIIRFFSYLNYSELVKNSELVKSLYYYYINLFYCKWM